MNKDVLPHHEEYEQGILGAVLVEPGLYERVGAALNFTDFYTEKHQIVWSAMDSMRRDSVPIDLVTVRDRLADTGALERVGGASYLTYMTQIAHMPANLMYYVATVKEDSRQRDIWFTSENGLTGNDIVELVCPGGKLGEESRFDVSPDQIFIITEIDPRPDYQVSVNNIGAKFCTINAEDTSPKQLEITDREYELCRERLITGCGLDTRPIPTLSEWGLIAMAGVLGIIGLLAIRRRKATA